MENRLRQLYEIETGESVRALTQAYAGAKTEDTGFTEEYTLWLEKKLSESENGIQIVTAHVTIGKSKKVINYTFNKFDFIRTEGNRNGEEILFVKGEHRILKITEETKRQLLFQMNHM